MQAITIRHFQPADRAAVYQIASETAFFGDPVEAFMDDRRLFCDAFVGYYTTYKTEYCWVADKQSEVVGYLLGSTQTVIQSDHWLQYMVSRVIVPAITRQYQIGKRTVNYGWNMIKGYFSSEEPPVDLAEYPAHLHINIMKDSRGFGIGGQLLEAYFNQLCDRGIYGVYLHTTSQNEAACRLYEKLGFQILSSRRSSFWSEWFGHSIDNRSYGLKLV